MVCLVHAPWKISQTKSTSVLGKFVREIKFQFAIYAPAVSRLCKHLTVILAILDDPSSVGYLAEFLYLTQQCVL